MTNVLRTLPLFVLALAAPLVAQDTSATRRADTAASAARAPRGVDTPKRARAATLRRW
jgi:hypothetical protein